MFQACSSWNKFPLKYVFLVIFCLLCMFFGSKKQIYVEVMSGVMLTIH